MAASHFLDISGSGIRKKTIFGPFIGPILAAWQYTILNADIRTARKQDYLVYVARRYVRDE